MGVIAVTNLKGGTDKITTTVNVAAALGEFGSFRRTKNRHDWTIMKVDHE